MAVSETVIAAYVRLYSKAQLETAMAVALNDRATGVIVTQVNFSEGGGAGQMIAGDPNEIIEILELAIQRKDNPAIRGPKPMLSGINFNTRRFET